MASILTNIMTAIKDGVTAKSAPGYGYTDGPRAGNAINPKILNNVLPRDRPDFGPRSTVGGLGNHIPVGVETPRWLQQPFLGGTGRPLLISQGEPHAQARDLFGKRAAF